MSVGNTEKDSCTDRHGGIIPPVARRLHAANIETVVNMALERSGVSLEEIDAVAATVKPGVEYYEIENNKNLTEVKEHGLPNLTSLFIFLAIFLNKGCQI